MTPIPTTDRHITSTRDTLEVMMHHGGWITITVEDDASWETSGFALTDWRDVRALIEMLRPRMAALRDRERQEGREIA